MPLTSLGRQSLGCARETDAPVTIICFGKRSYSVFTFLLVVGHLNICSCDTRVYQMDECLSFCQKNLIL